jgi:hypothetical protein
VKQRAQAKGQGLVFCDAPAQLGNFSFGQVTGLGAIGLAAIQHLQQRARFGESEAKALTLLHKMDSFQVLLRVLAVAVKRLPRLREEPFSFVETNCLSPDLSSSRELGNRHLTYIVFLQQGQGQLGFPQGQAEQQVQFLFFMALVCTPDSGTESSKILNTQVCRAN